MDDNDTVVFEWKLDYAEKKKMKKHIEDGNMKPFYLFTARCSLQMFTEIKSLNEFEDLE